jgi:hypothetical protein
MDKTQLSTNALMASQKAYYLIDLGSQQAIDLLVSYYKFDRQDAIDGWNKAKEDNDSYWRCHFAKSL